MFLLSKTKSQWPFCQQPSHTSPFVKDYSTLVLLSKTIPQSLFLIIKNQPSIKNLLSRPCSLCRISKPRLDQLQMQEYPVFFHQFSWRPAGFDSKWAAVSRLGYASRIIFKSEILMHSEIYKPCVFEKVQSRVKFAGDMKQLSTFCQSPAVQILVKFCPVANSVAVRNASTLS